MDQKNEQPTPAPSTKKPIFYKEAVELVRSTQQASIGMLQRRLRCGYVAAARCVDQMEQDGHIGPYRGEQPREVLIAPLQPKED